MVKFYISCRKHSTQLIHKPTTSIINEQCTCFVVSQERMHKTALITGLLDEVFSTTPSLMEEIASSHRYEDNTSHVAIETKKTIVSPVSTDHSAHAKAFVYHYRAVRPFPKIPQSHFPGHEVE